MSRETQKVTMIFRQIKTAKKVIEDKLRKDPTDFFLIMDHTEVQAQYKGCRSLRNKLVRLDKRKHESRNLDESLS